MNQRQKPVSRESEGSYSHAFVYRIQKKNHAALLGVLTRLDVIYKKHGMLESRIFQLGKSNIFQGFESFEKLLGTSAEEEIWISLDTYENAAEFTRIVDKIGKDPDAGPLWGELAQITAGRLVVMGEFDLLSRL
jgi:hypothetical protein